MPLKQQIYLTFYENSFQKQTSFITIYMSVTKVNFSEGVLQLLL